MTKPSKEGDDLELASHEIRTPRVRVDSERSDPETCPKALILREQSRVEIQVDDVLTPKPSDAVPRCFSEHHRNWLSDWIRPRRDDGSKQVGRPQLFRITKGTAGPKHGSSIWVNDVTIGEAKSNFTFAG